MFVKLIDAILFILLIYSLVFLLVVLPYGLYVGLKDKAETEPSNCECIEK